MMNSKEIEQRFPAECRFMAQLLLITDCEVRKLQIFREGSIRCYRRDHIIRRCRHSYVSSH